MGEIYVCDISNYQVRPWEPPGTFDFQKMKAQGVGGVIYRATCQPTSGNIFKDYRFDDYVGHNDQVPCMGYYLAVRLEKDISMQVEYYLNAVKNAPVKRAWVDIEGSGPGLHPQESLARLLDMLVLLIKGTSIIPGIYTRQSWYDIYIAPSPLVKNYPLWAARYYDFTTSLGGPWGDGKAKFRDWDTWTGWQYTDRADGLAHGAQSYEIDKNVFIDGGDPEPPPPQPEPEELTLTVTAAALNVRSGPGTNYAIVDRLVKGDRVTVENIGGTSAWVEIAPGKWAAVQYGSTRYMERL